MLKQMTSISEALRENSQLENKFTPLSQKTCFWGFLLPPLFSLCPSKVQMQTITRRPVTLPASKKTPISNIGGRWKDLRREPREWQSFDGGSFGFAQTDLWLWLMRRRCRPHTWLCDVQWWTWGRLNRVVLGWFGPDAARRGPQERLCYQPPLIFVSVLFLLSGAESSISTKLEQAFRKKELIEHNCKIAKRVTLAEKHWSGCLGLFIPIATTTITHQWWCLLWNHFWSSGISQFTRLAHFRCLLPESLCTNTYQSTAAGDAHRDDDDDSSVTRLDSDPPQHPDSTPVDQIGRLVSSSIFSRQVCSNCVTTQSAKWMVRANKSEKTQCSKERLDEVMDGSKPPRIVLDARMSTLAERQLNKLTAWSETMYSNLICNFPVCVSRDSTSVKLFQVSHCSETGLKKKKKKPHKSSIFQSRAADVLWQPFLFLKSKTKLDSSHPAAAAWSFRQDCIWILRKQDGTRRTGDKESVHTPRHVRWGGATRGRPTRSRDQSDGSESDATLRSRRAASRCRSSGASTGHSCCISQAEDLNWFIS